MTAARIVKTVGALSVEGSLYEGLPIVSLCFGVALARGLGSSSAMAPGDVGGSVARALRVRAWRGPCGRGISRAGRSKSESSGGGSARSERGLASPPAREPRHGAAYRGRQVLGRQVLGKQPLDAARGRAYDR